MGNSIQKKIKFSKGQISPNLIERTDLETYNSSAQKIKNCVSTIYGGIRTRRGTSFISNFIGGLGGELQEITTVSSVETYNGYDDLVGGGGWKSEPLLSKREVLKISVPKNDVGGTLFISGLSSKIDDKGIEAYRKSDTGSFETEKLYNGVYSIKLSAGGGWSASSSINYDKWSNIGVTGGSGAGVDADFYVNGVLSGLVGVGAAGSGSLSGDSYLKIGQETCFTLTGGKNAVVRDLAGAGGVITYSESVLKRYGERGFISNGRNGVSAGGTHASGTIAGASLFSSNEDETVRSFGSSGTVSYGTRVDQSVGGNNGGFLLRCLFAYIPVVVETSIDGTDFEEVYRTTLSEVGSDFYINIPAGHKYMRFVVDVDDTYSLSCGLSVGSLSFWATTTTTDSSNVKMIDFVYNNDQKYLLILTNEKITVFSNDTIQSVINADGLLSQYIPNVKYAIKDDLIVFTHQDMPTKTLKRTNAGWEWKDFEYQNIPYYAFDGEKKEEQTVGITPSGLEGSLKITADSAIFDETWVGQRIDGNGGVFKITEFVKDKVVNGVTIIPFYTEDKIEKWTKISGYEPVWGKNTGYPTSCIFAQQRLWFGGSKKLPSNIWASRVNDYYNFKNAGNYANDSIDVSIVTNNRIYNMVENRGLHIFTAGEEWTSPEGSFTPDGFSCSINTRHGSLQNITPVVIGGVIVFVEKNGNSILSYVYDYNQASYTSDDLSVFTNLVKKPVAISVLSNSEKDKGDFMFVVLEDGTMLVVCISFQQNIFSVSEYETSGQVKDVCCVGEDTYIIVLRNGVYSLEKISDDKTDMTMTFFADSDILSEIGIYNNQYVYVYSDNEVYGKYFVESGSLNIGKIPNEQIKIGIAYDYSLESNPIAINNQTITKKKRIAKATVYCENTDRVSFCGQEKMGDDIFSFYACTSYQKDVRFNISGEFYPVNVLSVTLNLNYED